MRNVEGARVTSSTAEAVAPARYEHLRVNYQYRGHKPLDEDPVPSSLAGAAVRTANREERKRQFKAILAAKGFTDLDDPAKPITPTVRDAAGLQVGVTAKIARIYLRELREQAAS